MSAEFLLFTLCGLLPSGLWICYLVSALGPPCVLKGALRHEHVQAQSCDIEAHLILAHTGSCP